MEKKSAEDLAGLSFQLNKNYENDPEELDTLLLDVKFQQKRSSVEFLEIRLISAANWYLYVTTFPLAASQSCRFSCLDFSKHFVNAK